MSWEFHVRKASVFRIQITYATDSKSNPGRWHVRCDNQDRSWSLQATGGLETFVTDDQVIVQIKDPGMHTLELHVADMPPKAMLSVKSVVLVPRRRQRFEEK